MKNINLLFVWTLIARLQGCAVADIYNMQGMEGRVVDKATQQPLDGVMVIEVWGIGGGFEGHEIGYLPLSEAGTDDAGRYVFQERGTKRISEGFLTEQSPWMIYFKPGYVLVSKNNRYHPDRRFEYNRRSDWDEKTIELEKLDGTPQAQAKELERFSSVLGNFTGHGGKCVWTEIPNTLWVIYQEHKRLLKEGILAKVAIGAPDVRKRLRECPSAGKFNEIFSHDLN